MVLGPPFRLKLQVRSHVNPQLALLVDDQIAPIDRELDLGEDDWDDTARLSVIHRSQAELRCPFHVNGYVLEAKVVVLEAKPVQDLFIALR